MEYNMYVSTHVSLFCVCIVFVFCYMLLSKEEIKKEEEEAILYDVWKVTLAYIALYT